MKLDESVGKAAEAYNGKMQAVMEKVERSLSSVISTLVLISCILAQFLIINIRADFGWEFFISLGINLAMLLSVRFIWLPEGRRKGIADPVFIKNKETAGSDVGAVFKNKELTLLNNYCTNYATPQNKEDTIKALLETAAIDYEFYKETYAALTAAQVNALELTRRQKRAINKVNAGKVKYPKISAAQLMGGFAYHRARYVVDDTEKKKLASLNIVWTVSFAFSSFALNMIAPGEKPVHALSVIAQSVLWAISTIMSAFIGFNAGVKLITVNRNAYYVSVIRNLAAFNEWKENGAK